MKHLLRSVFVVSILLSSCSPNGELESFAGFIQGSTYSIIYENRSSIDRDQMRSNVEEILHNFDLSLSIYDSTSIVSKVNRNEDVLLDKDFINVFNLSAEIYELSNGSFDVTIAPLVDAWGFGPDALARFSEEKRDSLMTLVGMDKIRIDDGRIEKENPNITLDFNAIAQGYSSDIIGEYFEELGINNYLIEIGGEVRAGGTKLGQLWRVGIDKPSDNNNVPGEYLQAIIRMKNISLATSGNYRKFYIKDGVKYSHTIDPKTGNPVQNTLLSATILAKTCGYADGIATTCMVLGKDKAIEFINDLRGVEGYLIFSDENGEFQTWISKGLRQLIEENPL